MMTTVNGYRLHDMNGTPLEPGMLVEIQHCTGRYGQTQRVVGRLTGKEHYMQVELDNGKWYECGFSPVWGDKDSKKVVGFSRFEDYEHGHDSYIKVLPVNEGV